MAYVLGATSLARLAGVDPRLVRVVKRAIQITSQDFTVQEGLRTRAQQIDYVRRGVSRTMESRHLTGHAVDLVPWSGGKAVWDWPLIYPMADAVRRAAIIEEVQLVWGGVWDRMLIDLPEYSSGLEKAVAAYTARRKAMGKSAFLDGVHFEIPA